MSSKKKLILLLCTLHVLCTTEGISISTGAKGVRAIKHWSDKKIRLGFVPCLTQSLNLKQRQQRSPQLSDLPLNVWVIVISQVLPWWQFLFLPTVTSQPHRSDDSHKATFSLLPIFLEKHNLTTALKIHWHTCHSNEINHVCMRTCVTPY